LDLVEEQKAARALNSRERQVAAST